MKNFFLVLLLIFISINLFSNISIDEKDFQSLVNSPSSCGYGRCDVSYYGYGFSSFGNPASSSLYENAYGILIFNSETNEKEKLYDLINRSIKFNSKKLGFVGLSYKGIQVYYKPLGEGSKLEYEGNKIYDYEYSLSEYGIIYSKYLKNNNFAYGINLKYLQGKIYSTNYTLISENTFTNIENNLENGNGYNIDFGFLYTDGSYILGVTLKNAYSKIIWDEAKNTKLTRTLKWGLTAFNKSFSLSFEHSKELENEKRNIYYTGIAYMSSVDYFELNSITFRYGMWGKSLSKEKLRIQTLGVGFNISKMLNFDFAFEGNNINIFKKDGKYNYLFGIIYYTK